MTDHSNEHQPLQHEMTTNYLTAMRIKEERINRNITQQSMAEQLHMDISIYSRLENGKIEISIARLETVAAINKVPVVVLLPPNMQGTVNINHGTAIINGNGTFNQILDQNQFAKSIDSIFKELEFLKNNLK